MSANFFEALRQQINTAYTAEKPRGENEEKAQFVTGDKPDLSIRNDDGVVVGLRTQLHITETRPKGTSNCPLHPDAFFHAAIIRSVNNLPDSHRVIVRHLYGPNPTDWAMIQEITAYCWARLQLYIEGWCRFRGTALKEQKMQKLKGLVFSALQQYREQVVNNQKLYTVEVLAGLLGVSDANWRRDWAPFWRHLQTLLSDLDTRALLAVASSTEAKKQSA